MRKSAYYSAFSGPEFPEYDDFGKRCDKVQIILSVPDTNPKNITYWEKMRKIGDYSAFSGPEFPEYDDIGKRCAKVHIILPFRASNS